MNEYQLGDIIFYKNIKVVTSALQRKVLGIPYSHNALYTGVNQLGRMEEFEANLQVGTTTFTDSIEYREVYHVLGISDEIMKDSLNYLVDEYEEKVYGFISWPAIALRRIFELIGFKEARKWNILWGWGVMCSELVYYFLVMLALRMGWTDLLDELRKYNPNLFHPGDTKAIIDLFPKYFARKQN